MEREIVRSWHGPLVLRRPERGPHASSRTSSTATGVDELMLTTMVYGQADRLRSYELVAEAWDLSPAAAA